MPPRGLIAIAALVVGVAGLLALRAPSDSGAATKSTAKSASSAPTRASGAPIKKIVKSEEEWMKELTPEQYQVMREKGTERAFTGKYWDNHAAGIYTCAACDLELFSSDTKFDSGTGWPSFWAPIAKPNVTINSDTTFGMAREEVVCSRCGGHLGHLFDDGPKPTGLRYCMNSVSLKFEPKK
jgi:peptide-methionine (R)-S-oxide reductase